MQDKQDSKLVLAKQWQTIYTSKDRKLVLGGNVQIYKIRPEGQHFVVLNPTYPVKKENSLTKNSLKNKSVFVGFDNSQYNYSNITDKEIMFHINLDEEEIITKQNTYKITENFFQKDDQNDQIESHVHPVLINSTPLCRNHSILVMYPDQELPQIIGQDIVLLLLNIFKLFPNVKIGYNSIGASSLVNHLHFHLLFPDDLIQQPKLPLERVETTPWIKSSLINPHEQINLYSVGVRIDQFDSPIAQGFVISPVGENLDPSEVTSSLSFVFGLVANELIELCIPHNVLFTDGGNTIFIIVRQFNHPGCLYGWLQFSGVVPVAQDQFGLSEADILKLKKELRVDEGQLQLLRKNVARKLQNYV